MHVRRSAEIIDTWWPVALPLAERLDSITIMCDGTHAVGKDFRLRMRMNDLHDRVGRDARVDQPTKGPKMGLLEPLLLHPKVEKRPSGMVDR